MKNILFLLILAGIGYTILTKPEVSEQIQIHLAAIQRHAVDIAKEKAGAVLAQQAQQNGQEIVLKLPFASPLQEAKPAVTMLYTSRRITETSNGGVRSIEKDTAVHILQMNGDHVTVTDGKVIVTTTPDSITDVAPVGAAAVTSNSIPSQNGPSSNRDPVQDFLNGQNNNSSTPQVMPVAVPAPASSQPLSEREIHNQKLQAQISVLDERIMYLEQENYAAYLRNGSSYRVTITRNNMEIQRLSNQKYNLARQMK